MLAGIERSSGMNCVNDPCTLVLSSSARKLQNYKTNQKNFKKKVLFLRVEPDFLERNYFPSLLIFSFVHNTIRPFSNLLKLFEQIHDTLHVIWNWHYYVLYLFIAYKKNYKNKVLIKYVPDVHKTSEQTDEA